MTVSSNILKELETSGFVVIHNFLTAQEVKLLVDDFSIAAVSDNQNYRITFVSEVLKNQLIDKVRLVLDRVHTETNMSVDTVIPCANYMDTAFVDFPWHQDHESYYTVQQHYNYLNFFIPIIKPDITKTGMSLVPNNRLAMLAPEQINRVINNGASRYIPNDNQTTVYNDDTGVVYTLPVNIDTIAVTPAIGPGDLLLVRGDVIHKTQDHETHRIAVSIRATDGNSMINLQKLLTGSSIKQTMIKNNQTTYNRILEIFKAYGSDELPAAEFYRLKDELFFK